MTNHKNIPALRFKEFVGEWEVKKLGELAKFSKGKGISKKDISDDGIECIRYGELYTTYGEVIEEIQSKTNIDKDELVFSQANDVIIPASGETAFDIATASCVINDGIALGGDLNIIRTKINGVFLSYYLNNALKIPIARLAQGVSVSHLYSSQLKTLKLNLPTKPEQQKIANFLTTIDTKIQQLRQKEQLLDKYKKGVMQQIFKQEIRFKDDDGGAFEDWEVKRLKNIGKIVGGGTPSTSISEYWNGDIYWFTPTEIKQKYISKSIRRITKKGLEKSSAKMLPIGTILFSSRATIGDIGITLTECTTNQGFQSFIVNEKITTNEFMYYWIIQHKKEFIRRANGSTFLEISKSEIEKIKIQLPELKEQQKIAKFLSSIDEKIGQVREQVQAMEAFKKGLLQGMFV